MDIFTVTRGHIKLLEAVEINWNDTEAGAPGLDPKQPYGSTSVFADIAEILDWQVPAEEGAARAALQRDADQLHREMQTVLQIMCDTLALQPGEYQRIEDTWHPFRPFEDDDADENVRRLDELINIFAATPGEGPRLAYGLTLLRTQLSLGVDPDFEALADIPGAHD